MTTAGRIKISIIATSFTMDRCSDVCELLDSIKAQQFTSSTFTAADIETIFIAEGSQELHDRVKQHAEKVKLPNFRIVFSARKLYLSGARQVGAEMARGDIIGFVDDDSVLFPEWAEETIKAYKDPSVIGVTGAALPLWRDKDSEWLPREYYWLISCTDWTGWDKVTEARSLWGMNMSLRREAFEKAGTFMTSLGYHQPMAEDLEFSLRVKKKTGKRLLYVPRAKVYHKVYAFRISPRFVAARAHHIGVSRRILRSTDQKQQASFAMERGMIGKMVRIIYLTPVELFRNPAVAVRKFSITVTIAVFAGVGFVFPGKGMRVAAEIQKALE